MLYAGDDDDGVTASMACQRRRGDDFEIVGEVPTPGDVRGRYLSMAWVGA